MNDIDINCDFEQSIINEDLHICKRCGTVVHKNTLRFSSICPVLLDKLAMDPNHPEIQLSKIETINPSSNTITSTVVPEKAKTIDNDWWNNSIDVVHVKPVKKEEFIPHKPPLMEHPIRKQCSEDQINQRMNICQGCEFFQDNTCLQCGCALSRDKVYMNKLLWADQSCPIGKWGPVNA